MMRCSVEAFLNRKPREMLEVDGMQHAVQEAVCGSMLLRQDCTHL